jgi:hypothetical protein
VTGSRLREDEPAGTVSPNDEEKMNGPW